MILRVGNRHQAILADTLYTIQILRIRRRGPRECLVQIRLLCLDIPFFLRWIIPNTDAWYPLAQVIGFIDQVNIFQEAKAKADIGWTETDSVDGRYAGGGHA